MKQFLWINVFLVVGSVQAWQEYGRWDGGEYCLRPDQNIYKGMPKLDPCGKEYCSVRLDRSGSGGLVTYQPESHQMLQGDMNFTHFREQFPILRSTVRGNPLIYFDTAATAQMPSCVLQAIVEYYEQYKSNVGRGMYAFAEQATQAFELTRAKVAYFLGAKTEEISFTSGATDAINRVVHIWAQHNIATGDEIIISQVEHNANFLPWQQLAAKRGIILKRVPVSDDGTIHAEVLKKYVTTKTKLIAITHQSNILGSVSDIASIVEIAREVGAKVLVDAAQSVAHQKIDVQTLGCDFLVFSGHKLFGPTGVGVLFMKKEIFKQCQLDNFGGGMVLFVEPETAHFKDFPHCLEPGTQPIAQVIGLGAAIDFILKNINFEQMQTYETKLVARLTEKISTIPGLRLISPDVRKGGHNCLVTFVLDDYHAYDVAQYLSDRGIAVRAGYHCVQVYHEELGGYASVRVSVSAYNTVEEIDFLATCLRNMVNENME